MSNASLPAAWASPSMYHVTVSSERSSPSASSVVRLRWRSCRAENEADSSVASTTTGGALVTVMAGPVWDSDHARPSEMRTLACHRSPLVVCSAGSGLRLSSSGWTSPFFVQTSSVSTMASPSGSLSVHERAMASAVVGFCEGETVMLATVGASFVEPIITGAEVNHAETSSPSATRT